MMHGLMNVNLEDSFRWEREVLYTDKKQAKLLIISVLVGIWNTCPPLITILLLFGPKIEKTHTRLSLQKCCLC
jgi:hypothetical protein